MRKFFSIRNVAIATIVTVLVIAIHVFSPGYYVLDYQHREQVAAINAFIASSETTEMTDRLARVSQLRKQTAGLYSFTSAAEQALLEQLADSIVEAESALSDWFRRYDEVKGDVGRMAFELSLDWRFDESTLEARYEKLDAFKSDFISSQDYLDFISLTAHVSTVAGISYYGDGVDQKMIGQLPRDQLILLVREALTGSG